MITNSKLKNFLRTMESYKNHKDFVQFLDFLYCFLIWIALIFVILPILVIIFLPLYFWKTYVVTLLAKVFKPKLVNLLDGYDGILAVDPFWTNSFSTLVGLIVLEGSVDSNQFREKVLKVINETKTSEGKLVFRKMAQFPVPFCGYYFWQNVEDLADLSNHFHAIHEPISEQELKVRSAKLIRAPFRNNGPLWDITIYTNYEGDKTALQIRMNHIIGDGMTCLKFFHKLCDYEQPPIVLKNDYKRQNIGEKIAILFRAPAIILHLYLDNLTNSDIFNRTKTENEYLVSWTTFPSDAIKRIREKTNVHFSSIGLSLFGGFLMRHFSQERAEEGKTGWTKEQINDHVKIMLPLPWPNHPNDKMVNHWLVQQISSAHL